MFKKAIIGIKAAAVITAFAALTVTAAADEKIGYGQGVIVDGDNRPVGATDAQEKYSALGGVFIGEQGEKRIYLTFDEGYENGCTSDILNILNAKGVSATFYITYDYAARNPELVARMAAEGHKIGNHTYSHPSLPDCTDEEFFDEVIRLEQYVYDNFGVKTETLRPPMGEFSTRTLTLAKEMGYKTVFWSFAYADWETDNQPNPAEAYKKITAATHDGAIYLLHAVSKTNTAILGDVIDYWRARGYEITAI
ncbi:MAG: polysaccharide deacetylase family protein [Eubacterium sp.]|nr:polysaccharide deacetylase family protein [Eubacterium sp.]